MSKNELPSPEKKTPDERIKMIKKEVDRNTMEEIMTEAHKQTSGVNIRVCEPRAFNLNKLGIDLNECSVRYTSQLHAVPNYKELDKSIPTAPFSSKTIYDDELALGWILAHRIALMNAMIEEARIRANK